MMKVNWEVFFGNSSTEEAICLFAGGYSTFKQFSSECWPKECKQAIRHLKRRGYTKSIRAAQRALRLRGFSDYKENYRGYRDL